MILTSDDLFPFIIVSYKILFQYTFQFDGAGTVS